MSSDFPIFVGLLNSIQFISLVTGQITGIVLSVALFMGLYHNKGPINAMKSGIMIFTGNYCISFVAMLMMFPTGTYPTGGFYVFGEFYPRWLTYILTIILDSTLVVGCTQLAVIMVYRVLYIVRPDWLPKVQVVFTIVSLSPILLVLSTSEMNALVSIKTCDLICIDVAGTYPTKEHLAKSYGVSSMNELSLVIILYYSVFFLVLVVGIPSILIINNWLAKKNLSPQTKKLQKNLTAAWICMILAHCTMFFPTLVMIIGPHLPTPGGVNLPGALMMIALTVDFWVIPLEVIVLFLAVRAELRSPDWLKSLRRKYKFSRDERVKVSVITS